MADFIIKTGGEHGGTRDWSARGRAGDLKNTDCLLKNAGFLLKNADFLLQNHGV